MITDRHLRLARTHSDELYKLMKQAKRDGKITHQHLDLTSEHSADLYHLLHDLHPKPEYSHLLKHKHPEVVGKLGHHIVDNLKPHTDELIHRGEANAYHILLNNLIHHRRQSKSPVLSNRFRRMYEHYPIALLRDLAIAVHDLGHHPDSKPAMNEIANFLELVEAEYLPH